MEIGVKKKHVRNVFFFKKQATWKNSIRNLKIQPIEYFIAQNTSDVVKVVSTALERSLEVRAIGSGHSFSKVAATDGLLIDISQMNTFKLGYPSAKESFQAEDMHYVDVEAGITIHDLNSKLDENGLALDSMGGIDHQTLAGAISTGTHGSGISLPPIHAAVCYMVIVTMDEVEDKISVYRIEPSDGITDGSKYKETYKDPHTSKEIPIRLIQDDSF